MARVSIVVRTKDRPWFLQRALGDIQAQVFSDYEVIVVNDGGDVATVERIVQESKDELSLDVVHLAGGGRCAAANAGVSRATGEYLVLHDDDDLWEPRFLQVCVDYLDARPQDAGVATRVAIRYERWARGEWVEVDRVPFWSEIAQISLSEMLEVNRMVPIAFLYRRAVHDSVGGYDERLDAVEDWEFSLRVLASHTIGFVPEVLALWTQRPSATGDDSNSMFALREQHARDDLFVRDRALSEWIDREGPGLPLMIAGQIARLRRDLHADLVRELDRRHPVYAAVRRMVLGWRRRRGARE